MVFKLHDTYGFPLDLTREIAEENNLKIDEDGFKQEMSIQKETARSAHRSREGSAWEKDLFSELDKNIKTEFVGYEKLEEESKVLFILKENEFVDYAQESDLISIILDKTPFYAESGGQVGDKGIIESKDGKVKIVDCKKTPEGKYIHIGEVESGIVQKGSMVHVKVEKALRMATAKNHTTTHILQKALKNILGDHVNQSGSSVDSDRLRFDFTHFSAISKEQLQGIENEVNEIIMENINVIVQEMSIDEAKKEGAMALFGEKYGNIVRVVKIGDYSKELCGGTHISSTSQAGLIKILSESGIAAGVRRIEALTGHAAIDYLNRKEEMLNEVASSLKSAPDESIKKIEALNADLKKAQKEIEELRNKLVSSSMDDVMSGVKEIKGIKVLTARFDQMDMQGLRNTSDTFKNKLGSCVVVLATGKDEKVNFVVTATKDLVSKGVHSGNIIKEIAKIAGGSGGGRPDMAQAGGKDASKIDEALEYAMKIIEEQVK